MTNSKNTRRALLISVLTMTLSFVMLIGTTFAWFTDSVSSGKNKIVAGNLDIEVTHTNNNVTEESLKDAQLFPVELWEPGVVSYETFTVKNAGSLAFDYTFSLNVSDFNTIEGTEKSLKDVIKLGILEGSVGEMTREELIAAVKAVEAKEDSIAKNFTSFSDFGFEDSMEKANTEKTFTMVAYWEPTENDNDYNVNGGKTVSKLNGDKNELYIEIAVNVVATQRVYESDSFGKDYDDVAMVSTVEELKAAFNKGTKNVVLTNNMEISENINITKDVNLDLNGKTIINNASASRVFFVTEPNVTLTIDGTKEGSGIYASDVADGKTYGIVDMRAGSAGSKLVVNGGTYTANTDNGALFKVRDNNVEVELNNVTATTNRWIFDTNSGPELGTTLTVNGGKFTSTEKVNGNMYSVFRFVSIPVDDKPNISFTDTTIVSAGGACIDLNVGIGEFNNCNFTVTNPSNPAHNASAMSVSNGSSAFINGGTYTSEGYGMYVFTSGGNIVIDGGAVITGKAKALACSAASYYYESGQITLNDGTINGDVYAYNDGDRPADITINGGSVNGNFSTSGSSSATIHINGGTFTVDPTDYIDEKSGNVANNGDGTWTVVSVDEGDVEDPLA